MSLTVEKVISDAKRMASRLKDRNLMADQMIIEATIVAEEIEALRQLQDDFEHMNQLGRSSTNTNYQLVLNINAEHPHIREIQMENRELRSCLQDHQRALEHIMSKYREHTQKKILNSQITFNYTNDDNRYNNKCTDKILEMVAVMREAAKLDDNANIANEEQVVAMNRLMIENKGLREMLQISKNFGSIAQNVCGKDISVQTDITDESLLEIVVNAADVKAALAQMTSTSEDDEAANITVIETS